MVVLVCACRIKSMTTCNFDADQSNAHTEKGDRQTDTHAASNMSVAYTASDAVPPDPTARVAALKQMRPDRSTTHDLTRQQKSKALWDYTG